MDTDLLKETFYSLVAPDLPNDWDVEEAVENLAGLDEHLCHSVLNQVPVIWPVSHSLCFDYLKAAAGALACIEPATLPAWVNRTLDQYEKNGLRSAQRFMADVEENFLCPLRGESGLRFAEVAGRLLPYLRGLSGRKLELAVGPVSTDTSTIVVPPELSLFQEEADNFFLYKLIISYQWAFIAQSTLTVSPRHNGNDQHGEELWLQGFLRSFSSPALAQDLYHLLETARIKRFLARELPGLMRRMRQLADRLKPFPAAGSRKSWGMAFLRDLLLDEEKGSSCPDPLRACLPIVEGHRQAGSALDSIRATADLYPLVRDLEPEYIPLEPLIYQGSLTLDAVRVARQVRLAGLEERFVDALASRLLVFSGRDGRPEEPMARQEEQGASPAPESGIALVVAGGKDQAAASSAEPLLLTINNQEVALGEELEQLADEIISELGHVPAQYVTSAAGRAGRGYAPFRTAEDAGGKELVTPVMYDEWDYRRSDFRKNWVSVQEKALPLLHSSFVQEALNRYHGQIVRLRRQFEMLRQAERFVRRQREGEDIDLDAVVESLADTRAGLAASDRLFVRLQRDQRDIAVLFLIDMSNSTQGWVGQTIKEALVLLCEALTVLGDRYGIYGFSGMRRLRSDFFHIKGLDEPYDDAVRQRIGSIAPREYTRMGPALRHATSLLRPVEARTRLLITLSDGKPEDYDDYKGEYAIEDTRHALLEAKAAGIHPFCITIDRQAHEYMDHMYGERNYILIDDVRKLPGRMPEMYRLLTR
jgi:nitric oxide reductase NorD protein